MSGTSISPYVFVIDTEQYAGNFERELCAFVTGRIVEGRGEEESRLFEQAGHDSEALFDNVLTTERDDDSGGVSEVIIVPTPGWFNDGVGNHHRNDADIQTVKKQYIAHVVQYESRHRDLYDEYKEEMLRGKKVANWTIPLLDREIEKADKEIEAARAPKVFPHYAAYLSVGILFHVKPAKGLITFMKKRAALFNDRPCRREYSPVITITGYRVLCRKLRKLHETSYSV